jgi:hypothetical protein
MQVSFVNEALYFPVLIILRKRETLQLSWMPMKPKVGGLNHCADKKFFSKKLS